MKTGTELKARRLELGITQHDLADKIGVSRTQLSRMENGKIEINNYILTKIEAILTSNEEYKESELTINDIQVGDELECIDRKSYEDKHVVNRTLFLNEKLIVKSIKNDSVELECEDPKIALDSIEDEELKYFRKNPKLKFSDLEVGDKEIASFEELQYVANKALDESIIEKYEVCIGHYGNKNMIIHFDGKFTEYSDNSTNSGIEFIQSLYPEEFVIEKMADELRVKSGAELTLANGIKCVYFDDGDRKLRHDDDFYPCNFLILKGATVKQSKGAK